MARQSEIDVANLALTYLGERPVQSLDQEGNFTAVQVRSVLALSRRDCLSRSPWTFARKTEFLAEAESNPRSDDWAFRYRLPGDFLLLRHFAPERGLFPEDRDVPEHEIEGDYVYHDWEKLRILYIFDQEDVSRWSPQFVDSVALSIAVRVSPSVSRKPEITAHLTQMAEMRFREAVVADSQSETERWRVKPGGYAPTDRFSGGSTIYDGNRGLWRPDRRG